jgi:hypothetical protein
MEQMVRREGMVWRGWVMFFMAMFKIVSNVGL